MTKLELWSIVHAVTKWKYLLLGRPVIVRSDHSARQFLLKGKIVFTTGEVFGILGDFQLTVEYVIGHYQKIADFLSRLRPCDKDRFRPCRKCRSKLVANDEDLEPPPPFTETPAPLGSDSSVTPQRATAES